jgi:hypothetical protein
MLLPNRQKWGFGPKQITHQWGFHSLRNGRYFAADFCHKFLE